MTNLPTRYQGYLTCVQCGLPTSQRCLDCHRPLHRLNAHRELADCFMPHFDKVHHPSMEPPYTPDTPNVENVERQAHHEN